MVRDEEPLTADDDPRGVGGRMAMRAGTVEPACGQVCRQRAPERL